MQLRRDPKIAIGLLLFLAFTLAFFGYRLGLPGGFMFDDIPNLELLSTHGGVHNLKQLQIYLQESFSGPTGRPIAMLSFLLNSQDWPADVIPFKQTNILIHLLNALVLFCALFVTLRQIPDREIHINAGWIAALATCLWLLHPLHVSTVLFVVQRMAELAAFFFLLGWLGYFYGRRFLKTQPVRAYTIMTASLFLGTMLGGLAKENAFLMPLLVIISEYVLFGGDKTNRPDIRWQSMFLFIPSVMIIGYLVWFASSHGNDITVRNYNSWQRLLTEPRVLLDYLWNLIVPHPYTSGLFHDNFIPSKDWLSPSSTLWSAIIVCAMMLFAFVFRRHFPVVSFAILFFFAGHLIESTVIPLELYYEHRNYLPSLMLFLPVAWLLVIAYKRIPIVSVATSTLLLLIFTVVLSARANLWSDKGRLLLVWADTNPTNMRAQTAAIGNLENLGRIIDAVNRLDLTLQQHPKDLTLRLYRIRLGLKSQHYTSESFQRETVAIAKTASYNNRILLAARLLTDEILKDSYTSTVRRPVKELWLALNSNHAFTASPKMISLANHELGKISLIDGDKEHTIRLFRRALQTGGGIGMGLRQAVFLASHNYFCEALNHLQLTSTYLSETSERSAGEAYLANELKRLQILISDDAHKAQIHCKETIQPSHAP